MDVDDTLVLYDGDGSHPYGVYYGEGRPNKALIGRILLFEGDVFVWSGGGLDYARAIGRQLLPAVDFTPLTKDQESFPLVRPGDIVVDDQPIPVRTHTPFEEWGEVKEAS